MKRELIKAKIRLLKQMRVVLVWYCELNGEMVKVRW